MYHRASFRGPGRSSPAGFTLTEVLVVIGIIALLVGLLLPAVQKARDTVGRTACANNIRQVAIAMARYEQTQGFFPILKGVTNTGSPLPCGVFSTSGPCSRASSPQGNEGNNGGWMHMLPYFEELRLYDQLARPYSSGGNSCLPFGPIREYSWYPPYQAVIPAFQCPTSPLGLTNTWAGYPGRRNYFMCVGDSINAGNINSVGGSRGIFGISRTPVPKGMRVSQIADGTSKTILLGEKGNPSDTSDIRGMGAQNIAATDTKPIQCLTVAVGYRYNSGVSVQTSRTHTSIWHNGNGPWGAFNTVLPPNSPTCMSDPWGDSSGLFSASSYHAGGVNVAMADTAVRWITDGIDTGDLTKAEVTKGPSPYGVWGALGTANGAESIADE